MYIVYVCMYVCIWVWVLAKWDGGAGNKANVFVAHFFILVSLTVYIELDSCT